jgi:hypothetical protein
MSENALVSRKAANKEYLSATVAGSITGIDWRAIEKALPADAVTRSRTGKQYALYLTSSVTAFAARAKPQ